MCKKYSFLVFPSAENFYRFFFSSTRKSENKSVKMDESENSSRDVWRLQKKIQNY